MTGFEPQISSVEGDRSTNWATTTAQQPVIFLNGYSIWVYPTEKTKINKQTQKVLLKCHVLYKYLLDAGKVALL